MGDNQIGSILEVDLKTQTFKKITFNKEVLKSFLGGPGFGIYFLMNNKIYESDPLSKDNPLIFMTGLLAGSSYPCSGFYSVSAKSPLTNSTWK